MATDAQLAAALGVSRRTVTNWRLKGMPTDPGPAADWKAKFHNPDPTRGGTKPGAGRPKGSKNKAKAPPTKLSRAVRLEKLERGELTKAEVDFTLQETRAIDEARDAAVAAGEMLDAAEVEETWGALLQTHGSRLDELPQEAEAQIGMELRLTMEQTRRVRAILEDKVEGVRAALMKAYTP